MRRAESRGRVGRGGKGACKRMGEDGEEEKREEEEREEEEEGEEDITSSAQNIGFFQISVPAASFLFRRIPAPKGGLAMRLRKSCKFV